MREIRKGIQAASILMGLIILAQMVMMFLPYYTKSDIFSSIQGYVWLNFGELEGYFQSHIPGYNLNLEVIAPVLTFVLGLLSLTLWVLWRDKLITHIVFTLWAITGLVGFGVTPTLRLGSMYRGHVLLFAVGSVVAVYILLRDSLYFSYTRRLNLSSQRRIRRQYRLSVR